MVNKSTTFWNHCIGLQSPSTWTCLLNMLTVTNIWWRSKKVLVVWLCVLMPKAVASFWSICALVSLQKSGPSWWSSRNVWTSRQTWGSSCCRTSRISSGRNQRSRWNTPGTWRSWPNDSWQRLGAQRTTNSTSKHLLTQALSIHPVYGKSRHCQIAWSCGWNKNKMCLSTLSTNIPHCLSGVAMAPAAVCAPVYSWQTLVWRCGFAWSDVPSGHFIHSLNTWQGAYFLNK